MWAEGADIGGYRTLALRSLRARLDRPGFLAHARSTVGTATRGLLGSLAAFGLAYGGTSFWSTPGCR